MKQFKSILLIALIIVGCTIHANAQDNQESPKLSGEQKRFDLNRDGKLSNEEDDLMLRVTSIEAFTGNTFSREDIERMQRSTAPDRAFGGPGGMPGFGGFGGGRGGPRPPEKLVEQFDTDEDSRLTGPERQAALEARGGGNVTLLNEASLKKSIQNDMQASFVSAPESSPSLYNAHTLRTLYLRFHHEDWYEQMNAFYRTDI